MSKTPTIKELKEAFWLEENGTNKYKHNTKHQRYEYKRDKKEVLKEYTKKLYRVWRSIINILLVKQKESKHDNQQR